MQGTRQWNLPTGPCGEDWVKKSDIRKRVFRLRQRREALLSPFTNGSPKWKDWSRNHIREMPRGLENIVDDG